MLIESLIIASIIAVLVILTLIDLNLIFELLKSIPFKNTLNAIAGKEEVKKN